MAHRTKLTIKKRADFLKELAIDGNVSRAAEAIGISRPVLYLARDNDQEFAARWKDAVAKGDNALVDEARKRALGGSDTLLIFMIKGRKPQYRDSFNLDMPADSRFQLTINTGPPPAKPTTLPEPVDNGDD